MLGNEDLRSFTDARRPVVTAEAGNIVRQILRCFFRNRETGAITTVQAPNLVLWMVIAAAALCWIWSPASSAGVALTIAVNGGVLVWSLDEIL